MWALVQLGHSSPVCLGDLKAKVCLITEMNSFAKKQKSVWFLNQKYSHLWSAKEFVAEIMFCDMHGQMFCSEIIRGE